MSKHSRIQVLLFLLCFHFVYRLLSLPTANIFLKGEYLVCFVLCKGPSSSRRYFSLLERSRDAPCEMDALSIELRSGRQKISTRSCDSLGIQTRECPDPMLQASYNKHSFDNVPSQARTPALFGTFQGRRYVIDWTDDVTPQNMRFFGGV